MLRPVSWFLFLIAAAGMLSVVSPPDAGADDLVLNRIGARTERRLSTIESRGDFQVDDAEAFFSSLETNGMSVRFEYTDTVSDPGFADGDLIPGTDFTWDATHCEASSNRKSITCNDKDRNTYIKLKPDKKGPPTSFKMKTYVRRIEPPLFITPGVGQDVRFVMEWTDSGGGTASVSAVMDRCDWKRGPKRTTRHLKCPTRCGGSPLAICGSAFCEGSNKCK